MWRDNFFALQELNRCHLDAGWLSFALYMGEKWNSAELVYMQQDLKISNMETEVIVVFQEYNRWHAVQFFRSTVDDMQWEMLN